MTALFSFILALGVLIFVHEFGHFLIAKRSGVLVEIFSLGFGPRLFGFRWAETDCRISLLPLGGYVKMLGQEFEDEASTDLRSFSQKKIGARASIIVAGPVMNFLLPFLLLPIVFLLGYRVPAHLTSAPVIQGVMENLPAEKAGLQAGDEIRKVGDVSTTHWAAVLDAIAAAEGKPVELSLRRGEEEVLTTLTPQFHEEQKRWLIGVQMAEAQTLLESEPLGFGDACVEGAKENMRLIAVTSRILLQLVTFDLSYKVLGGPIAIAKTTAEAAKAGLAEFLYFISFLSIQLAMLNLLPIPVLDGGHLFFLLVEKIRGKVVSLSVRRVATQVGFFLLIALMLVITINDIDRAFGWKVLLERFSFFK